MNSKRALAVSLVLMLAAASCGGSDGVPVSEDTAPTTTLATSSVVDDEAIKNSSADSTPSTEVEDSTTQPVETPPRTDASTTTVEPVVEGPDPVVVLSDLFSGDLERIASAGEQTAPGSPAYLYAAWQLTREQVAFASGQIGAGTSSQVTRDGDEVKVCDDTETCSSYANFAQADGLLTTFTIAGEALDGRLGGPGELSSNGPITVQVLGSYNTVSGSQLGVHLQISSTETVDLALYSAGYVTSDGQQVAQAAYAGLDSLRGGATTVASVYFLDVNPGGTIYLESFGNDFSDSYEFELPVPAL